MGVPCFPVITLENMTQHTESPDRLARPLIRLARMVGVATSYVGMSDDYHEIDDDVLVGVLAALGIDAATPDAIERSIRSILDDRYSRLVAPTVLHTVGQADAVMVNAGIMEIPTATITLEDGGQYQGDLATEPAAGKPYEYAGKFIFPVALRIPADLPAGYHTLHVEVAGRRQDATLVSAPAKVPMLDGMREGHLWGWMEQMYSVRSAGSWGVGDFEDLKRTLVDARRATGADFVLVNPVHAAEPVAPLTPSPYLPISRRFVNFTYIRPEAVPEYAGLDQDTRAQVDGLHAGVAALNDNPEHIDRDAMWVAKMRALWLIFKAGRPEARQAEFDAYKAAAGDGLEAYATWCLCYDKWGAPDGTDANWEKALGKDSPEIAGLRGQYPDTLDFYRWLEWIAVEQLNAAQQAAREAGMPIGIMADMAVGVHPLGADVWWNPQRFAKGATVGAPPDMFNQQGQDWSQPPLNPLDLEATGYEAYRAMVRDTFAHAGAVRIDHILGLFRLWWIPSGRRPLDGAYVHYDADTMLGILALEAERAGGVVVGEDLGVVPAHVADSLSAHGVLGCAVEWFEQFDGTFRKPQAYRPYALASVNTHDLPPAIGYLEYEHVHLRERLGLLEEGGEAFERSARAEQDAMVTMLIENGYLDPAVAERRAAGADGEALADVNRAIVEAQYRALKDSPCKLLAASLTDAVGERRAQNQPGTNNEYPNWRIPLADGTGASVPLEGLFDRADVQRLAAIMRG